jgi:hypothetical protein
MEKSNRKKVFFKKSSGDDRRTAREIESEMARVNEYKCRTSRKTAEQRKCRDDKMESKIIKY